MPGYDVIIFKAEKQSVDSVIIFLHKILTYSESQGKIKWKQT